MNGLKLKNGILKLECHSNKNAKSTELKERLIETPRFLNFLFVLYTTFGEHFFYNYYIFQE